jgi:sugar phosphate isomerase/epimerase
MTRRDALKTAFAAPLAAAPAADNKWPVKAERHPFGSLKIGMTSYTTREYPLDASLKILKSLGVGYVSIKDVHVPLGSTKEERKSAKDRINRAGLTILGCGVISLKNNEAEIRRALEYVRDLGAPTAVVAPDPDALPALNKVVKDFDLRVAIHNHGPEDKKFPAPSNVYDAVQSLDAKIGLCIDVGHTFRTGMDPAAAIRKYAKRLYDVHIKDIAPDPAARLNYRNVPLGTGVIDVAGYLKALVDIRYAYHVALEYEAEPENPVAGMAASFGFIRGFLAV